MDWTQIIISLISTGAFVSIFTIREKKTAMMLDNAAKLNEGWTALANERQEMLRERDAIIKEKDAKIDTLYGTVSDQRHQLDDANTRAAVAEVLRCDTTACPNRVPPFGTHLHLPSCNGCQVDPQK